MNFQGLKVEKPDFYLEIAYSRASRKIDELRPKLKKDRLPKSKTLELTRIEIINTKLSESLTKIIKSFPNLDNLDEFYRELIKVSLDYGYLKKSLGSVDWAVKKNRDFFKIYKNKIKKSQDLTLINKYRKEYGGRVSSVIKQIKHNLAYLEESRKVMKNFPRIKTSLYTVCIFGFPNVGKSTLLKKLTQAEPEIKAYPFTTKTLNLGYIKQGYKIQLIDTPGTLNRIDKMNKIEKQAFLAVKYLADQIVFVFDASLDMKKQVKLLLKLKEFDKPVILYLSKTDISEGKEFIKKFPDIIKNVTQLKDLLLSYRNSTIAR